MNIVLITTGNRRTLLYQSLQSLYRHAAGFEEHHITVVCDDQDVPFLSYVPNTVIVNTKQMGASASRNIGAGSIPRYRRQQQVMFLDDDVYMCDRWDLRLGMLATLFPHSIISGYSHPFNQCESKVGHVITERNAEGSPKVFTQIQFGEPLVISSVAMMMDWRLFDQVGPWDEPGGPGGSEDYALCMRAKEKDFGFAVTDPQCVIHTGMFSSDGKQIVGYDSLAKQNEELLRLYNLEMKVQFG